MAIRLGKTKDSRTRKKGASPINIQALETLKQKLSDQKTFTDYLLQKGFSISTTERYVGDVESFIKWAENQNVQVEQISYADLLLYIKQKRRKLQQRTISCQINSLKHYYHHLTQLYPEIEDPTTQLILKGIKRRSLYYILSSQELETLYADFDKKKADSKNKNMNWFKASSLSQKRDKVILGMMIYQGMGTTELNRLQIEDVKLREGKVFIRGGRRSNERTLELKSHQIMDCMEYQLKIREELLALTGKQKANYFVSSGQSDRIHNVLQRLMRSVRMQNAKVKSAKQIRASVITHWLKRYNLREVQYMAGHRYVSSTEGYLINDMDDLQEDINKFHPIG